MTNPSFQSTPFFALPLSWVGRTSAMLLALLVCFQMSKAQNAPSAPSSSRLLYTDRFTMGKFDEWHAYGADIHLIALQGNPALQTQGDSQVFWGDASDRNKTVQDVTVQGEVAVERNGVSSGFLVRASKQGADNTWSGYYACVRKLGVGYAIVQLFRFPDYTLLQEARVRGTVEVQAAIPLKITCKGPNLWVWANDMSVPAITEYDDKAVHPGFVGFKSENNKASLTHFTVRTVGKTPRPPLVRDWGGIKGAVFITSDSVNAYQMWEEYHPDVIDQELSFARLYGLNTVQVYLNFLAWQRYGKGYLAHIEDFLQRASKHGLKVTFIFFDDVGNIEPPHLAPYPAPIPGVHNSQMQGCPGRAIIDQHYAAYRARLKAYVQAIARAHKNDTRIAFWQTYNEPSHATTLPLLADAYAWIKEMGSRLPVTATGGGAFYGSYYSDFPSFHSYLDPQAPASQNMVLADGGSEHVCTETLDRPGVDVAKLTRYFAARKTGWVIWELMIGRDNCRFPWGSSPGAAEPVRPFHGLLYPDGHPWALEDIQQIQNEAFRKIVGFKAEYFEDIHWGTGKKTSLVPRIALDLNSEPGTGSSDASAGIGNTNWSIRYTGDFKPVKSGVYTLSVDTGGIVHVWLGGKQILNKPAPNHRRDIIGSIFLRGGQSYPLVVEYAHESGPAHLRLYGVGPGMRKQILPGPPYFQVAPSKFYQVPMWKTRYVKSQQMIFQICVIQRTTKSRL